MIAAPDYGNLITHLTFRFLEQGCKGDAVRLTGIAFCRPESKLAREEIFPSLDYWQKRSGKRVTFYFGGYMKSSDMDCDGTPIGGPDGEDWSFSARCFDDFRNAIESSTKWKYSGECDFILTNARFNPAIRDAFLDFSSAVCIQLDRLKEVSAIPSVSQLFERIFQYAERQNPNDPASGFSDWAGLKIARGAFKNFILSWLPNAVQGDALGAFNLATVDISI